MKKTKTLGMLFVLFVILIMIPTAKTNAAVKADTVTKKKPKLNSKNITMTVGQKKTLKLKDYQKLSKKQIKKVKWSSSNSKTVSVKPNGKYRQNATLTAKKSGNVKIKLKYNGKAYTCKVAVKENKNGSNETKPCFHDWDEGIVIKSATCTEKGEKVYTCKKCKDKKLETLPVTAHNFLQNHQCSGCGCFDESVAAKIADCSIEKNNGILCYVYKANNYTDQDPRYDMYIKSYNIQSHFMDSVPVDKNFNTYTFSNTDILNTYISTVTFVNKVKAGDNVGYMFKSCTNATYIDVSNLDVSNVEFMDGMFHSCSSLIEVNMGEFDARRVYGAQWVFSGCKNLKNIRGKMYFENVENVQDMFRSCEKLETVDLSGFHVENVTDFSGMFQYCYNITNLDLSGFKNTRAIFTDYMFGYCDNLNFLDLKGFDTACIIDAGFMFFATENLKEILVSDKWILQKNCDTNYMFAGCGCKNVTVKE